ncbi:MAG: glycosyltransferase family 4 protein, partial [Thermoguttaceae bacterium]|nr:glycosyltransferase family 4 protein [Thermoguttaceae bacterium]
YGDVIFHVTSPDEARDVRRLYPRNRQAYAPDLVDESVSTVASHTKCAGTLRLVWLGRVAPIKRFDYALSLLSELDAPIRFDVYGPMDGDAVYQQRCERLCRTMPKNITVEMHGPIPYEQTATAFAGADFFILPTRNENFGHSIIEAMRYGCPVIISDTTCRRHLAEIGAGWDLPDQRGRWLEILRQCVAMDDATYQRHREAARKYAEQQIHVTNIVDENIYMFMESMEDRS